MVGNLSGMCRIHLIIPSFDGLSFDVCVAGHGTVRTEDDGDDISDLG